MRKTSLVITLCSLLLAATLLLNLTGCTTATQPTIGTWDLMETVVPAEVTPSTDLSGQNGKMTDFALRLLKASEQSGKNTLVSPLSVLCALGMTANGAKGDTLSQMESVFGMTAGELNLYLYSYVDSLPAREATHLSLANSIWFTKEKRFTPNRDFLQANADYYGADLYRIPFDDENCRQVNKWVNKKTNEMIPEILDQFPKQAVMVLINALAFEGDWQEQYHKEQVRQGEFTTQDGEKQTVDYMYGTEYTFLQDEKAIGFIKKYEGMDFDSKFSFVALLPNEGVSITDYLATLDGQSLQNLLNNPQQTKVLTALPKFETQTSLNMNGVLKSMGMTAAFDETTADFTGLGKSENGNICISDVLHKTYISVAEQGTEAGAATAVIMKDAAATPDQSKEVYLDRPFVYMIVDNANNVPFFIGTMMSVK